MGHGSGSVLVVLELGPGSGSVDPCHSRGSAADVALPRGALTAPCSCRVHFELQAAVVCALARVTH